MMGVRGHPKAVRWLITIAGGVLVGVLAGMIMGWQVAPGMVLIYFLAGWAAERGQREKREIDAYREVWLNRRKSQGGGAPPL
jgi:hypothetical protein